MCICGNKNRMGDNMRIKNISVSFIIMLSVIFAFFADCKVESSGDISKATIDYGTSDIYSREDMDAAIAIIKEYFRKWDGCELHSIRYTDDDYCNNEANIKWMNDLAKGRGMESNFTQCIAFFSSFHSPKYVNSKTSLNIDEEYDDWSWYLARIGGGEWKLITFGY